MTTTTSTIESVDNFDGYDAFDVARARDLIADAVDQNLTGAPLQDSMRRALILIHGGKEILQHFGTVTEPLEVLLLALVTDLSRHLNIRDASRKESAAAESPAAAYSRLLKQAEQAARGEHGALLQVAAEYRLGYNIAARS